MARFVVVVVVLAALFGAILHPLIFVLSLLPFNTIGLQHALDVMKTFISDFLAWGFLALLGTMGTLIAWSRLTRSRQQRLPRFLGEAHGQSLRVAVGITAYNDDGPTARTVREFLQEPSVIQVIVVDNNSTDDTPALARAAGGQVIFERRQGYGYACMRALKECLRVPGADVVVLVEGDGTFAASDLPKFLSYLEQADMVVGTRVVPGLVDPTSQMDYFFTWGNLAVSTLLRLRFWNHQFLGAARLTDVGCTYRAIRRAALERILPDMSVGGYHFSPHMMIVALARGLSLIEIPITFKRRVGHSKGASQSLLKGIRIGLSMIWHILTYVPKPRLEPMDRSLEKMGIAERDS